MSTLVFALAFGAVVAALSIMLALVFRKMAPSAGLMRRATWAGLCAAILPILAIWFVDAIESGEPKLDFIGTFALGTLIFGVPFGIPLAYAVSRFLDDRRGPVIDPKVFE